MNVHLPAAPAAPARHERGITLVEVVAALALTSLVLLTVAGAYFTLYRSMNALVAADGQARQRAVYRRLRGDLQAAYVSPNTALPLFAGEVDRLSFAARLGPTGLSQVEYLPGPGGLERRVTPWVPEGADGAANGLVSLPGTQAVPLVEAGREVRFRYLSRAGGWSTRWSGGVEGGLPVAVEVSMGGAGGERLWVLPLPAGSPPGEGF